MDLVQLEYFLDVAETEHVTKSARRLRVAQPALTRSIRRLEAELGVKLFERVGRNIRLTPSGRLVRRRVEPLVRGVDDMRRELAVLQTDERHTVRIGLFSASVVVIDAVSAYRVLHPETRFQIGRGDDSPSWDILVDTVSHGGFLSGSRGGEYRVAASLEERILVAVAPDAPLADDEVSVHDLEGLDFIRLTGQERFSGVVDELCVRHGFVPKVVFESDNPSVVRQMIGLGQGIGFWPEYSWGALDDSGVRFLRMREVDFRRRIVAAASAHRELGEEARLFLAFLVERLEERWGAGTLDC